MYFLPFAIGATFDAHNPLTVESVNVKRSVPISGDDNLPNVAFQVILEVAVIKLWLIPIAPRMASVTPPPQFFDSFLQCINLGLDIFWRW